jgi:hypothetical protein
LSSAGAGVAIQARSRRAARERKREVCMIANGEVARREGQLKIRRKLLQSTEHW